MTETMTDEQFADWLREQVATYNAPPPTPSALLWSRVGGDVEQIVAGYAQQALASARSAAVSPATPTRRRWGKRWYRAPMMIGFALAATLIIGIGVGRWSALMMQRVDNAQSVASANGTSTSPEGAASAHHKGIQGAPNGAVASASHHSAGTTVLHRRGSTRVTVPTQEVAVAQVAVAPHVTSSGSAYTVVTSQHLADAEALLTAFRSDAKAQRVDPSIRKWARDLLVMTRVLYDSPSTQEPKLRALLADLELVLVQIATSQPQRKGDMKLAAQALDESDILPRLRQTPTL